MPTKITCPPCNYEGKPGFLSDGIPRCPMCGAGLYPRPEFCEWGEAPKWAEDALAAAVGGRGEA